MGISAYDRLGNIFMKTNNIWDFVNILPTFSWLDIFCDVYFTSWLDKHQVIYVEVNISSAAHCSLQLAPAALKDGKNAEDKFPYRDKV